MSNRNSRDSRAVQVSKAMSHLLRHDLERSGIDFDTDGGWVLVDHMLALRSFQSRGITREEVAHAVASCAKRRFLTKGDGPEMCLSAAQGHSVASVNEGLLVSITAEDVENFPVCVHGTTADAWERIKRSGLDRMGRNHIHMARFVCTSLLVAHAASCQFITIFRHKPPFSWTG
mmetsp:Transcript_15701/g.31297  ORF Transcript_15701/g.31297 Transcript_15701/m.31297 type:complete len:174 (-) Transcript_15701:482-1003(-)